MTKVRFMGANGEMKEIATAGILESLEFVVNSGIKGAKLQLNGVNGEWTDADNFIKQGQEMFAPISEEEAAARDAEFEAWKQATYPDGVIRLTIIEPCPACGGIHEPKCIESYRN